MSTNVYLECINPEHHTDEGYVEIAQHMSALGEILDAINKREELASAIQIFINLFHERPYMDDYTARCANFFQQHPECDINVVDEYGKTHHTSTRKAATND